MIRRYMISTLAVLFGLHQAAQRSDLRLGWADAWLDDLLCLPLVLVVVLAVHRAWRVRNDGYVLPVVHVLAAWLLVTLVFELALPAVDAAFTADPLDVAAYGAGAVFFQAVLNRPGTGPRMARHEA